VQTKFIGGGRKYTVKGAYDAAVAENPGKAATGKDGFVNAPSLTYKFFGSEDSYF